MPKDGDVVARITSGELSLEFICQGDRYQHVIAFGSAILTATTDPSLETPVFQEVHQQGDIIFASGMSGDRHWSTSIEPCASGFAFDVACRAKTLAKQLGIAYEGTSEVTLQSSDDTRLNHTFPGRQLLGPLSESGEPPYTLRCHYCILAV